MDLAAPYQAAALELAQRAVYERARDPPDTPQVTVWTERTGDVVAVRRRLREQTENRPIRGKQIGKG